VVKLGISGFAVPLRRCVRRLRPRSSSGFEPFDARLRPRGQNASLPRREPKGTLFPNLEIRKVGVAHVDASQGERNHVICSDAPTCRPGANLMLPDRGLYSSIYKYCQLPATHTD
jgi:hypothetical protein